MHTFTVQQYIYNICTFEWVLLFQLQRRQLEVVLIFFVEQLTIIEVCVSAFLIVMVYQASLAELYVNKINSYGKWKIKNKFPNILVQPLTIFLKTLIFWYSFTSFLTLEFLYSKTVYSSWKMAITILY